MKLLSSVIALVVFITGLNAKGCDKNICWKVDDYPEDEIGQYLKGWYQEESALGDVSLGNMEYSGLSAGSCGLCLYEKRMDVHPVAVRDLNHYYYVVSTQKYQQNITMITCKPDQTGSGCKNLNSVYDSYMSCEQKRSNIRLLVYDPKTKKLIDKVVEYPSACICIENK